MVGGLSGTGLKLTLNGSDELAIAANGSFTFPNPLASGATYEVRISAQPSAQPAQICAIANGSGTVSNTASTVVSVTCRNEVGRFVYVANASTTMVSAFSIELTGALTPIQGSPFPGGGIRPLIGFTTKDERFVYFTGFTSTSPYSGSVAGFAIDNLSGALTQIPGLPLDFSEAVNPVRFHPSGKFLYFHTLGSGIPSINAYQIDPNSGALAIVSGSPYPLISSAGYFDSGGRFFYVPVNAGAGGVVAYKVDVTTGALTESSRIVSSSTQVVRLAIDPADKFLYAYRIGLPDDILGYSLNSTNGLTSQLPATGGGLDQPNQIFFSRWGHLYVTENAPGVAPATSGPGKISAYSVDPADGHLTAVPGSPFATNGIFANNAAIDPTGRFMLATNGASGTIAVFAIDKPTGALNHVPGSPFTVSAGTQLGSVSFDPSGRFIYFTDASTGSLLVYSLDLSSGMLTLMNSYSVGAGVSQGAPTVVGLH